MAENPTHREQDQDTRQHHQTQPAAPRDAGIAEAVALVARLRRGERRAIAQAITEIERLAPGAANLLRAMQPHLGHAVVLGFTGPPGAGKSTLVNALIRELRTGGRTVGVIAVDPSSPVSGGAILGDRIRMTAALDDDGVFVRSLASRGYLGGLSPAAVRIIDALDAARFDVIVLETVGTGQNEIDVAEVADVRVVISAPGLGDDIQAMKSGLLEIADILVVNKGDREGAEQTMQQLAGALTIRAGTSGKVPLLKTTATTGEGLPELLAAIDDVSRRAEALGPVDRRRRRARYLIARAAADLVADRIRKGRDGLLDQLADDVLSGNVRVEDAARRILAGTAAPEDPREP
ncbi:MAG: methylmalonyl Co-A mutase-associated GTPase MeaB [Hyphomicrobiaceae bacterium]|nr:methylmalonyl Co-A mutase-associated GTPase MeaB [Hyphomicrobiaceae bacterium]